MEKKVKPVSVDWDEIKELACFILGLDENSEYSDVDNAFYEEFECTLESFEQIVQHLLPLCDVGKGTITKTMYRGFADREKHWWIIKIEK